MKEGLMPENIKTLLRKESNRLILSSHVSPDGDNIGSLVALYWILKALGKEVFILFTDKTPDKFVFLTEGVLTIEKAQCNKEDGWIVLDSSDPERLGDFSELLSLVKFSINIDHHESNTHFATYNWVEPDAAATGELIFLLGQALGVALNAKVANALYVALSTDTGSFRYANTTQRTMNIVAALHQIPFAHQKIVEKIYQNKPLIYLKLLSLMVQKSFFHSSFVLISILTQAELEALGARNEDTDGLVEALRDIENVQIACFIKEKEKGIFKGSLRAKDAYDILDIAASLGGGGHKKAAGFTFKGSEEEMKKALLSVLSEKLK